MKILLSAFLLLLVIHLNAQETERKVIRSKNGGKEEFYVLKSDNNIKHGSYERKSEFSRIIGEYKNGLKEGMWTEYSKGSRLRSRGAYNNNEQTGIWKFYNWEGELEQEYNFTTKELVSDILLEATKERLFKVLRGADTIFTAVERPPLYIGGKTKMQSALMRGSQIAILLRLTRASGKVIIGFTVDTSGKARDFRIMKGIHKACDMEALRMVEQMPPNWMPAKLNGELVEAEHSITITLKNEM